MIVTSYTWGNCEMDISKSLIVSFFGGMELRLGSRPLPAFPTKKSSALFAKLILSAGHFFSRDTLSELFWQDCDPKKGRSCLRTELWRIRRIIESDGVMPNSFVQVVNGSVGFNASVDYWLDVTIFENRLNDLLRRSPCDLGESDYEILKNCVSLYQGDFLENLDIEWCVLRRESLRSMYLMALEFIMLYHKNKNEWDAAINYAKHLLANAPLLEHIHVELMNYYYLKGNRPAALQQYDCCRSILSEELGISPMQRTEEIYKRIILAKQLPTQSPSPEVASQTRQENSAPYQKINEALSHVQSVDELLRAANKELCDH